MTTSSDYRTPSPRPDGKHWAELTATLPEKPTQMFGDWLDLELEKLEQGLDKYVTRNSLRKSLRRK
jgi:hypothetical protein